MMIHASLRADRRYLVPSVKEIVGQIVIGREGAEGVAGIR
jgi:hypothetical protein